ncbi:Gamma-glutamyltranspeptidase 1 [Chamberlinius hualienensis]
MRTRSEAYQVNYGANDVSAPGEIDSRNRWSSNKSLLSFVKRPRNKKKCICILMAVVIIIVLIIGLAVGLSGKRSKDKNESEIKTEYLREAGPTIWPESMVSIGKFNQSAVSSDSQVCSEIGSHFLRLNGSAVDAAIATLLCAGLYAPHSMGIGGGFFMLIYDRKSKNASVIDARETAPSLSSTEMFEEDASQSKDGPLSVAVPGELHGLATAHRLYGKIAWSELFQPTIELCYSGTKVTASLARALNETRNKLLKDPGARQLFFRPGTDEVLVENDIIKRPRLARTLEIISQNGVEAFYSGSLGKELVKELQQMGGILTMDDLRNYTSLIRTPVLSNLSNGIQVIGVPPPGSGIILANIMLVLDGYRYDLQPKVDPVLFNHRIIEAFKFAYSYRAEMGDPDFMDMTAMVNNLTSTELANAIRQKIWDNRTFPDEHYDPEWPHWTVDDHGTSHVSVLAPNGDAVTVTSTINLYVGSGIVSQATGIILNDEMDDFSTPNQVNYFGVQPSPSNFIAPGKRPVSSMAATIFTNSTSGDVLLVTGAAGGTRITTATTYVAVKNLMLHEDLGQAVEDNRVHHQLHPPFVQYENGFSDEILQGLKKLGHNVTMSSSVAVVNAIAKKNGTIEAVADIRKKGGVDGF